MLETSPATWHRGGRGMRTAHIFRSFVDFALHKYSAACALRKHRIARLWPPPGPPLWCQIVD
jgi:hypothetical protein